jgi:hypothetical protein
LIHLISPSLAGIVPVVAPMPIIVWSDGITLFHVSQEVRTIKYNYEAGAQLSDHFVALRCFFAS